MTNTYRLVNPYIKGEFKSSVKAKNSTEAAKKIYKNLSEHFNNNLPKFYFSIFKGRSSSNGKFYHFEVNEKKINDEVNFSLQTHTIKKEKEVINKFKNNLKNFKGRYEKTEKNIRKSKNYNGKKKKENLLHHHLPSLMIFIEEHKLMSQL